MDKQIKEIKLPEPIDAEVPEVIINDPELGVIQAQTTAPETLGESLDKAIDRQNLVTGQDNALQDTKE